MRTVQQSKWFSVGAEYPCFTVNESSDGSGLNLRPRLVTLVRHESISNIHSSWPKLAPIASQSLVYTNLQKDVGLQNSDCQIQVLDLEVRWLSFSNLVLALTEDPTIPCKEICTPNSLQQPMEGSRGSNGP